MRLDSVETSYHKLLNELDEETNELQEKLTPGERIRRMSLEEQIEVFYELLPVACASSRF
jgi:hypothetical protein